MLDIILVIILCRRIKGIVEPKGYKPGTWQFYVVITWFGLEIGGAFVSAMLGSEFTIALLSGVLCAILGSIALQRRAKSLPDINTVDKWVDNIGKEDDDYR